MADWKSALAALGATTQEQSNETQHAAGEAQHAADGEQSAVEKKKRVGVVYSTNPDFEYTDGNDSEAVTLPKNQQKLRLAMERAGRGGKTVTIVRGFVGTAADREALCKLLKQRCGVGGAVKESDIIIQGDHRGRLVELLKREGYTQTK